MKCTTKGPSYGRTCIHLNTFIDSFFFFFLFFNFPLEALDHALLVCVCLLQEMFEFNQNKQARLGRLV